MIQLLAIDCTFGGFFNLVKALNLKTPTRGVVRQTDKKNMHLLCDCEIGWDKVKDEESIIIGSNALYEIHKKITKKITLIITDSFYLENHKEVNQIIKDRNINVFTMVDKGHLIDVELKPFFQPFDLSQTEIIKNNILTVCHSPWSEHKRKTKGSYKILESVSKFNVDYVEILGKSWHECLLEKAKSHIFIDQLVAQDNYIGGLGKSGLEAMLLKCVVLTSGEYIENDYIEEPPVVWINGNNIEAKLKELIENKGLREEIINEQYEWAKKYTSYEFVANYILNTK